MFLFLIDEFQFLKSTMLFHLDKNKKGDVCIFYKHWDMPKLQYFHSDCFSHKESGWELQFEI